MNIKIFIVTIVALITFVMININSFAFAITSTANQTSNNMTTAISTAGSVYDNQKMHLDAAINALQTGDQNGALLHMNQTEKILAGEAKMHLDAAIDMLQSGDKNGALLHLQQAEKLITR